MTVEKWEKRFPTPVDRADFYWRGAEQGPWVAHCPAHCPGMAMG
jgi:hypothetical protein